MSVPRCADCNCVLNEGEEVRCEVCLPAFLRAELAVALARAEAAELALVNDTAVKSLAECLESRARFKERAEAAKRSADQFEQDWRAAERQRDSWARCATEDGIRLDVARSRIADLERDIAAERERSETMRRALSRIVREYLTSEPHFNFIDHSAMSAELAERALEAALTKSDTAIESARKP